MSDTIPARTLRTPGGRVFQIPELRVIGHSPVAASLREVVACWQHGHYVSIVDGMHHCQKCRIAWTSDATEEQIKADAASRSINSWGGGWD